MLLAVHYAQPPEWRWYILAYFLLAGLAGLLATEWIRLGRGPAAGLAAAVDRAEDL